MDAEASDRAWAVHIGAVLTEAAAGRLLGRSPQAVRQDAGLLRLHNRDGAVVYPTIQFVGSGQVCGVADVVAILGSALLPLTIASWLTVPNRGLAGRTPIRPLQSGDRDRVLTLARQLASSAST